MDQDSTQTTADSNETSQGWINSTGKIVGLILFFAILILPGPEGLPAAGQRLAAVTLLMAFLWLSQAIPIAATSLIPLALFPLLGIQTANVVSKSYISRSIFLFLGGFIIALGIEKWGLHRRIALNIVRLLGTSLRRVVLGFMLATAFLSMWISNTASTLLMLPIGLALIVSLREVVEPVSGGSSTDLNLQKDEIESSLSQFSVVLMLGIAYSASIGGFTTLVGTPTNVQFQQIWINEFPNGPSLSAGEWMTAVFPLGAVFLLCTWGVLVWRLKPTAGIRQLDRSFFTDRLHALGSPSKAEWRILVVFLVTAALWIFRTPLRIGELHLLPGWGNWVEQYLLHLGTEKELAADAVRDSTVAIGMALLLFFIPAERDESGKTVYLMDWKTAERLPWGILLLIGGGFAIANAFSETGLSTWLGTQFAEVVAGWPNWMLVGSICFLMTFLTEFTSNVATVSALLPILAGAAVNIGIDPRLIMFPATISTSCAFMLPIATPPNAIVFGSGKIKMGQMVRYGILLNLLGVALITVATFLFLIPQLGISLNTMPEWATTSQK